MPWPASLPPALMLTPSCEVRAAEKAPGAASLTRTGPVKLTATLQLIESLMNGASPCSTQEFQGAGPRPHVQGCPSASLSCCPGWTGMNMSCVVEASPGTSCSLEDLVWEGVSVSFLCLSWGNLFLCVPVVTICGTSLSCLIPITVGLSLPLGGAE